MYNQQYHHHQCSSLPPHSLRYRRDHCFITSQRFLFSLPLTGQQQNLFVYRHKMHLLLLLTSDSPILHHHQLLLYLKFWFKKMIFFYMIYVCYYPHIDTTTNYFIDDIVFSRPPLWLLTFAVLFSSFTIYQLHLIRVILFTVYYLFCFILFGIHKIEMYFTVNKHVLYIVIVSEKMTRRIDM